MKMLTALCLLALTACGSVDAQSLEERAASPEIRTAEIRESDTVSVQPVLEYGADVNRGPCATGFTRIAPGVCQQITPTAYGPLSAGCNTIDLSSDLPVNAKSVKFGMIVKVLSTNAVGLKTVVLQIYSGSDTTCTNLRSQLTIEAYEFSALASTTIHTSSSVYEFETTTGRNLNIRILENPVGTFDGTASSFTLMQYTD